MSKPLKARVLFAGVATLALASCANVSVKSDIDWMGHDRSTVTPVQASDSYYVAAHDAIDARIRERSPKKARNVILFVGDGMGVSTITAARIYAGQQRGVDGESYRLTMDQMPWSALSRTYSHDSQIADSAPTATAMTTGVKSPERTVGKTQQAVFSHCDTDEQSATSSLFEIAEDAGLATGVVSTARITHATPAATYAESVHRDWESDADMKGGGDGCKDIARQLIEWPHGDGFEVVLGGGREKFMRSDEADPEYQDKTGDRQDGRDLTAEWVAKGADHKFVYDKAGFDASNFASEDRIMGLFEPSHMQYELDRAGDKAGEPSLAELTRAAITRLQQDPDGFVLMVEAGRIDHAHHAGNAARALGDAVALDDALKTALEMTSSDDTLVLITADHSHTLTISGYSRRGNPILGLSSFGITPNKAQDGKPYTTLGYANGPGAVCTGGPEACTRPDLSSVDTTDKDFRQQSLVPGGSETHAGEDVAVFASGPGAELVSGSMEENEIFHVMARSLGLVE